MQIQNYKTNSLLGEGGMAKVYLAKDTKFDTNVAVKLLNKEYAHNENIRKRFLAEAKSMFRMSHPNIIKVTDLIDEQDTVAFVMEFVEGETLKDFIDRKRKLTDDEIVSVFSQMLDAVSYVHSRKLVHRDIKPSNFMVTPSGSVKLMDFGIAKNTDETSMEYTQTGTGVQMGTPMYMSPEQVTETKSVTAQSDIYSLGVVLWQMVTGEKPYEMKTLSTFQLQTKIVNERLPKTNTSWDVIIEKATSKEVEHRFSDCASFSKSIINAAPKNQEDAIERTVIEQFKPIEKTSVKDEKKDGTKNTHKENITLKKIKLVLSVLFTTGCLIYFGWLWLDVNSKDKLVHKNKSVSNENINLSVVIGNQEWMSENLNVTTFRNGDPIPHAQTEEEWKKAGDMGQPAWCYYYNDPENGKKYGKLYNWYAVNDPRFLAPKGWHVPSDSEWKVLIDFLGGENVAGKKMKSLEGWVAQGNGTNESGFNGLPGRFRYSDGDFFAIMEAAFGYWWSSIENNSSFPCSSFLHSYGDDAIRIKEFVKSSGLSVRCLKD